MYTAAVQLLLFHVNFQYSFMIRNLFLGSPPHSILIKMKEISSKENLGKKGYQLCSNQMMFLKIFFEMIF